MNTKTHFCCFIRKDISQFVIREICCIFIIRQLKCVWEAYDTNQKIEDVHGTLAIACHTVEVREACCVWAFGLGVPCYAGSYKLRI